MHIKIDHIAKIEGHAGFVADIVDGKAEKVRLDIQEGARLIEGILCGRNIYEAPQISARICGVCPVVHNLTSLKAIENALDIELSSTSLLLRKLLMLGQLINSHTLHLFFFSLSDFFGLKEDLKLIKKYPKLTADALLVRDFGNQIIEIIGGRSIHPINTTIGGFLKLPEKRKLISLFKRISSVLKSGENLAKLFSSLKYPKYIRTALFVSLSQKSTYAIYDGLINVSGEEKEAVNQFLKIVEQYQLTGSPVKYSLYHGKPFMVGALSRLNNNWQFLNPGAKKIFQTAKIDLPNFNPFYNILAQAIEIVHCTEESEKLLKKIIAKDLSHNDIEEKKELVKRRLSTIKNSSYGTAAIEAPRGTLYHSYEIDPTGKILNCRIITPTAQNIVRLEEDLKNYLYEILEIKNINSPNYSEKIKMLIRAYDPCITCAVH